MNDIRDPDAQRRAAFRLRHMLTYDADFDPFEGVGAKVEKPLAVEGMTIGEYLEADGLSRSDLVKIHKQGPWGYHWEREHADEPSVETDAMRLGTAIHLALLEPDLFPTLVWLWDGKTRQGKEWEAKSAAAKEAGATILTRTQYRVAEHIRDHLSSLPRVRYLFSTGISEVSYFWKDAGENAAVKARPDRVDAERQRFVDIKSTHKLSDWFLMRQVREHGYHVQAFMFLEAARLIGMDMDAVHLVWVKTVGAPHVRITWLPHEAIDEGERIYREALSTYRKCEDAGRWPMPSVEAEQLPWEEVRF